MIRAGVIGMGFMGGVHFRNWQELDDAQVVAVCDTNPIAEAARQGNISTGQDALKLDGVAVYADVGEMLANESLDAVSIALPTHLHKPVSILCLEAGVHVLCEKPMALNIEDCDAMIAAANNSGKQLMIAQCIRFWPVYVWARQAVESGVYGRVLAADFFRLTHAPGWDSDSWFSDPAKSGGIALDLHIHDLDFIQYLFGKPKEIRSESVRFENGVVGHVKSSLDYGDNTVVSATASWMMPESFGFEMSYRVIFERAAAVLNADGLKVYPAGKEPFAPEVGEGDGYSNEIAHFAALVAGEDLQEIIPGEAAKASVEMALETVKV